MGTTGISLIMGNAGFRPSTVYSAYDEGFLTRVRPWGFARASEFRISGGPGPPKVRDSET